MSERHDTTEQGPTAEKVAPGLIERCRYVTAANMRCLLASDEDHSTGHDILGDLHDDPDWGRQRAWAWSQIERSRLVGLLYERCACGHRRGEHTRGPAEPGGSCCSRGCACLTFIAPPEPARMSPTTGSEEPEGSKPMSERYKSDIRLGEKYRDSQTGIEGHATGLFFYQHGCERVNIEAVVAGKIEEYAFDAPRLVHIESGRRATTTRTGGPAGWVPPDRLAAKGLTARPAGALAQQEQRVRAHLRDAVELGERATKQRGCPEHCGCTDCDEAEAVALAYLALDATHDQEGS